MGRRDAENAAHLGKSLHTTHTHLKLAFRHVEALWIDDDRQIPEGRKREQEKFSISVRPTLARVWQADLLATESRYLARGYPEDPLPL